MTRARFTAAVRQRVVWVSLVVLAVLAYLPALASSPGRMPADTKLYLYLNPGRLISDARWTFDARQFAGWVPHQVISYLWPQGPWYWAAARIGLPDWVAHRLWIGTLMLLAGLGVRFCARRLGLGASAALAAAIVYQLSPYLLPYVSRTSAMLLPWAGLGWIVGCTIGAATRTRWRDAALVALIVATVGAPNPTALIMIAPAPVLYLVVAAGQRQITWRRASLVAARVGVLSLGVSLWWIAMVAIQSRTGADVLAYSESLDAVSFTSTSPEVWRHLGYWLSYIRDPYAATTTATVDYLLSGRVIATGFVLVLIGIAGLVASRWAHRRFAIALVAVGLLLAVGVHPIGDPSLLMDLLVGDGESGAGLALRSSTRAVPLLVLGLALGTGALIDAVGAWRPRNSTAIRLAGTALVGLLALGYLPALTGRHLVDPALHRDQDPPAAWIVAADALDALPAGSRVLQIPGAEFGAFRWGYTVDPPLPGLTERPLVTRDLLPLGNPAAMDLLYAIDERFQAGTIDEAAIAPIARLLGADRIWLTNDAAFERFRTPRPELTHDLFAGGLPGLGPPRPFGDPAVNRPDIPMVDETSVSDARVGTPVAPVELVAVEDPVPVIRAATEVVVVAGSGDGLVDAAAAGLVDGTELIRYAAASDAEELAAVAAGAALAVITDGNRDRAHHWRSSQDVNGFTEHGGPGADVLRLDDGDERLPVFATDDPVTQTIAEQRGLVVATASVYGEPFAYQPEHRPVMAVDGDSTTSWVVGDRAPAIGELIRLQARANVDHVTLLQPAGAADVRHVSEVSITVAGRPPVVVALDERSLQVPGQRVDIDPTGGRATIDVTVTGTVAPDPTPGPALAAVGFAEIDLGLPPTFEVVRPPIDLSEALATLPDGDRPAVAVVLTRLRTRPTDRWRADPEPTIVREFELPANGTFAARITVRLDQRAGDDVLAGLLRIDGARASSRLTGVSAAGGWAAADGDADTAWTTPFGGAVGSRLALPVPPGLVRTLTIRQPGGDHSPITAVRVGDGTQRVDVDVPAVPDGGTTTITLPTPLAGPSLTLEITAVEPQLTIDRRWAEPVVLPAAIAEISPAVRTARPATLVTACRRDLVLVDGRPLPVSITAPVDDLLGGGAVTAVPCDDAPLELRAGAHLVETGRGAGSGVQVDRIVLREIREAEPPPTAPAVTVRSSSRTSRDVTVGACPAGCWLVLGEGHHRKWAASAASGDLGPPTLVDGGFNGWWLPPSDAPTDVSLRWTAQRPLTIALTFSAVSVLVAVVLAVVDRRREPVLRAPVRLATARGRDTTRSVLAAGAVWVLGTVLLVEPGWVLPALAGAAALLLTRRTRLAGLVTVGALVLIGTVIVFVVHDERPFPDAGWSARFEWLHGLGLFAAVSLLTSAIGRARPPREESR